MDSPSFDGSDYVQPVGHLVTNKQLINIFVSYEDATISWSDATTCSECLY
jgi:hypothetical protein